MVKSYYDNFYTGFPRSSLGSKHSKGRHVQGVLYLYTPKRGIILTMLETRELPDLQGGGAGEGQFPPDKKIVNKIWV